MQFQIYNDTQFVRYLLTKRFLSELKVLEPEFFMKHNATNEEKELYKQFRE